jgi:hypothetical protein
MRRFFRLFDASVHTERTRLATITRLKSGSWRVQVRRKGKYVNETFLRRKDAEEWGIDIERQIDHQEPTTTCQSRDACCRAIDRKLLDWIVTVVGSLVWTTHESHHEVRIFPYLLVAHGRLEEMLMLINPLLEIEGLQTSCSHSHAPD